MASEDEAVLALLIAAKVITLDAKDAADRITGGK